MKKWLIGIAIVAGGLVALASIIILAAWNVSGFSASAAKADSAYAEWQKQNLPDVQDRLYLAPVTLESDNGAAALDAARSLLRQKDRPKFTMEATSRVGWSSGLMSQTLAANQDVVEAAIKAADHSTLRVARDWDLGSAVLFPDFADTKQLAKILCFDAERRAKSGDGVGAARNIRAARRLAWMSAQDPTLIGALVGIAIDAIALDASGICASALAYDQKGLSALRKALVDTTWSVDCNLSMRGEAYMALATARNLTDKDILTFWRGQTEQGGPTGASARQLVRQGLPRDQLPRAVTAELMLFWVKFYPRLSNPAEDSTALGSDMDAYVTDLEASSSVPKKIAAIFCPVYSQALRAMLKQKSEQAAALAFAAVLQHRQLKGKWPITLEDAGAQGVDELAKSPLHYRVDGASMRVWHVGQNGKDDGGVSRWEATARGLPVKDADNSYVFPWPMRPK